MIHKGIEFFRGRRVLLLQGPVGPFFRRLARALEEAGATVTKVNFNAGDWLFYPRGALYFRGHFADWPAWLRACIDRNRIDTILLFGDCRPLHQTARSLALKAGIELGVFEEGYLRPNFVTLERFGVNGYSRLPRSASSYNLVVPAPPRPESEVGPAFGAMAWQGFAYGAATWLGQLFFPRYEHHRPVGWAEAGRWIRAAWRKPWYRWAERGMLASLCHPQGPEFFLVPLQVSSDSQVRVHTSIRDIPSFIRQVAESFAFHAPRRARLVFKHHPLDRGHTDYRRLIDSIARELGIRQRTLYLHDQNLPTLLQHAAGVVVINSTVGLSSLHHGAPTMVCGTAVYDLPGLTFQGCLDDFWTAARSARPDRKLLQRFRHALIARTQLNGSFYRPLSGPGTCAGLIWSDPAAAPVSGRSAPNPRQPRRAGTPPRVVAR